MAKRYYAKRIGFKWELCDEKHADINEAIKTEDDFELHNTLVRGAFSIREVYDHVREIHGLASRKADALSELERLQDEADDERDTRRYINFDPRDDINSFVDNAELRLKNCLNEFHGYAERNGYSQAVESFGLKIARNEAAAFLGKRIRESYKESFDAVVKLSETIHARYCGDVASTLPTQNTTNPIQFSIKMAEWKAQAEFAFDLRRLIDGIRTDIKRIKEIKKSRGDA